MTRSSRVSERGRDKISRSRSPARKKSKSPSDKKKLPSKDHRNVRSSNNHAYDKKQRRKSSDSSDSSNDSSSISSSSSSDSDSESTTSSSSVDLKKQKVSVNSKTIETKKEENKKKPYQPTVSKNEPLKDKSVILSEKSISKASSAKDPITSVSQKLEKESKKKDEKIEVTTKFVLKTATNEEAKKVDAVLHVNNLSKNVRVEHLNEIFGVYGSVASVDLPLDRNLSINKGFAYIKYNSPAEADEAKKHLDMGQIDGRIISVQFMMNADSMKDHLSSYNKTTNSEPVRSKRNRSDSLSPPRNRSKFKRSPS